MTQRRTAAGWIIALTTLGVGIRLLFLLLAGELEPYADESNYLYLALCWNRFSVCTDNALYVWPPGYPLFLGVFLRLFGFDGVFAAKLCQVLLSGVVGSTTMLLANRLFGRPAALAAGAMWCFYAPLIGFTHYLWPETLFLAIFLPGMYLYVTWWLQCERGVVQQRRLIAAGLLIGLSMLVKEVALWWPAVLCALTVWRGARGSVASAVRCAVLFVLSVAVIVLPWTLRNYEVYGRIAPVGASLGRSVYFGLNAFYVNFDYTPEHKLRLQQSPSWLTAPRGKPWRESTVPNVVDRSADNVRRGLRYAAQHPGYIARTRVKKLADWVTPLSFFVRHYALQRYHGTLNKAFVRRPLVVLAVVLPMVTLAGAIGGFFWSLRVAGGRAVVGWTLLYFVTACALINGMSRFRVVVEPLLIALAAGFLVSLARALRGNGHVGFPLMVCGVGWLALGFLWCVNLGEIAAVLRDVW